jgi:hypothetical protein
MRISKLFLVFLLVPVLLLGILLITVPQKSISHPCVSIPKHTHKGSKHKDAS